MSLFNELNGARGGRAIFSGLFCFLFGLLQLSAQAQAGTSSLFVRWVPSPDPVVVGYDVYYGVESGFYTNVIDVGTSTNVTVSGLVPGVIYYFMATAYDAAGSESDPSNEASAIPWSTSVNHSPTLAALSDLNINENTGPQVVTLTGISSGATDEVQTLTVTASSSNPGLIPAPAVTYGSPDTTGALTLTPVLNAYGTAIITVTINDGGSSNNIVTRTFTVTINHINQVPTITLIPNQNIANGMSTGPIVFTIGDVETPAGNLILSAVSSNPTLIPVSKITFGGSAASRTIILAPVAGQSGTATASTSFQLVVKPRPAPPSELIISTL